jgi:O-acetylhomoserine (thiol)-lyase
MERHCQNTLAVAEWLEHHPKVTWVSYSGLKSSPYYDLARKYMPKGAGSVLTFGLKGGYDSGLAVVDAVDMFSHLANIGDTRSLILHPASTTQDRRRRRPRRGPPVGGNREHRRHHRRPRPGAGRGVSAQ